MLPDKAEQDYTVPVRSVKLEHEAKTKCRMNSPKSPVALAAEAPFPAQFQVGIQAQPHPVYTFLLGGFRMTRQTRLTRRQTLSLFLALLTLLPPFSARSADQPTPPNTPTPTTGKTLRVLKIGNSFSQNATEFLPALAKAQGHTLILGRAEIGGCTLKRHWEHASAHESDSNDAYGKPYSFAAPAATSATASAGATGDKTKPVKKSLKELLLSEPWDIVTLQQQSLNAPNLETYQPYAGQLAAYIRQHAPQAKIWFHETWAYRADDKLFKKDTTQIEMYRSIHNAYAAIAKEIQAERIIPVGTAFQNARQDPRWQLELEPNVDLKAYKHPALPRQVHALCIGYNWDTKSKTPKINYDGKHCSPAGKYLGALVWHETIFGPSEHPVHVPKTIPTEDALVLQDIANKTVRDGLKP